ncbi:MAG: DUF4405 domain-containing protein, partial [Sporomusa sp.]
MSFKTKIKVIVDVAMTALLLVVMAYHIIGILWHEWMGFALCILFTLHNLLNWNWYRALPKGRYTTVRTLHTIINFLLLAAILGMIVSGIMLSRDIFGFLDIKSGFFGRRLHMVSTSWGFILISLHLGLHWSMVVSAVEKRLNKNIPALIWRLAAAVLSVYGAYAVISREIWLKMFLVIEYAFFDYEESAIFFFAEYIAIMSLFIAFACYT